MCRAVAQYQTETPAALPPDNRSLTAVSHIGAPQPNSAPVAHRNPIQAATQPPSKSDSPAPPVLIVISPMTRTIQTALNAFPSLLGSDPTNPKAAVQI
ncbi:hypothetical protein BDW62DRAFT_67770 [Aspergillus aurantiobrunneus]